MVRKTFEKTIGTRTLLSDRKACADLEIRQNYMEFLVNTLLSFIINVLIIVRSPLYFYAVVLDLRLGNLYRSLCQETKL